MVKNRSTALSLTPPSITVTVADSAISADAIKFSVFKAVLSGKVKCLTSCGDIDVLLKTTDGKTLVKNHKVLHNIECDLMSRFYIDVYSYKDVEWHSCASCGLGNHTSVNSWCRFKTLCI